MDSLRLLRRSRAKRLRTNSPDRLVGDDNLGPVLDARIRDSLELRGADIDGPASGVLLGGLADAEDDAEAALEGRLDLGRNGGVGLAALAALGVAEDHPVDAVRLELVDGDLAGVGAGLLVVDVLRGDLDLGVAGGFEDGLGLEEVDEGGGDDDL